MTSVSSSEDGSADDEDNSENPNWSCVGSPTEYSEIEDMSEVGSLSVYSEVPDGTETSDRSVVFHVLYNRALHADTTECDMLYDSVVLLDPVDVLYKIKGKE